MNRKIKNTKIEAGDFVMMLDGENSGIIGVFENEWVRDGVDTFTVLSIEDPENSFWYVTKIELYEKAA